MSAHNVETLPAETRIRSALLWLALFMFAGIPAELWLARFTQQIPFALCLLAGVAFIVALLCPMCLSPPVMRGIAITVSIDNS